MTMAGATSMNQLSGRKPEPAAMMSEELDIVTRAKANASLPGSGRASMATSGLRAAR